MGTWARVEGELTGNLKVLRVWKEQRGALGLHLLGLAYCGGHLTDGLVPRDFVEEKLPKAPERERFTEALVEHGLWEPHPEGWLIHDYLIFNPSKERVESRRAKARKSADARWHKNGCDS